MQRLSRRQFVVGAGAAGLAGAGLLAGCGGRPFAVGPPATTVHRVAYLGANPPSAANDAQVSAFQQGMRDLGYVEGHNILIEQRHATSIDRLADPAAELVRLQPEVLLVPSATVARAVLAVTTTIPIVSAGTGTGAPELVASGLAASYARPGGTVTGLSSPSLTGKQLQLLQETVPALSRVAVLYNQLNPDFQREPFEVAAHALSLQLRFVGASGSEDLEWIFEAATRERADGLFLPSVGWITGNQSRIAELALQSRLPSMWARSDAVGRGGLMAYTPNASNMFRRAAYYVDRILKGAKPADLPVEQPMVFDFVVNMKTARELGITFPPEILLQVTEVIDG